MIYPPRNSLFVLFVKFGITFLVFFSLSGFSVFAQNYSDVGREIVQLEIEAERLEKIWDEQSVRRAAELFLKAAKDWENLNENQNSARCLREAVKLKLMLAEEKSAFDLLKKSLALEEKNGNISGKSETHSLLTIVSIKLSDFEKSRAFHREALQNAEKANQPKILAQALFASAFFYLNEPNFPLMKEQLEKSLQIYRKTGDKEGEAEVLIELAYSYIINNDRVQGRNFAQTALEIARENNFRRSRAFALIALGDAYQRMGEWSPAIQAFYEAETIFPENLDFYEKAILINRIGFYHLAFGDLNQAKKYFQKSLAIFNKIGRSVGASELLSFLGQIAGEQENYLEAMDYFSQSRKIAEKSNDPLSLGMLDLKIGESYFALGNLPEAEISFLNSLKNYKKIGLDFRVAEVEEKLGLIYEKKGEYEKARGKYLISLEINQRVHGKFAQAQNYYHLARLDYLQNKTGSALENINQSIKLTESSQGETANNQLKRSFISNVYDRYKLFISLLMKMHRQSPDENYAIQALQAAEKSRARLMLENLQLSQANFTKDADAETVRRETEIRSLLNSKADKLTDLLSQNADKTEIEKTGAEISELEHELEEIKAKLKQQSPIYSAIKNPASFDVGEFQRDVLDEDSLLLEFSFGKEESYLWAIDKNEVSSFTLPPREQIETKIQTLRELLSSREMKKGEEIEVYQARIAQAEIDYCLLARDLSNDLLGAVAGKLGNKRLIIVPDGKLNYFPVSALPLPNAETDNPVLLSNEVIYEPSASTLSILAKSANQTAASKNLLVFSDPVFSEDDLRIPSNNTKENSNTETAENFRFAESLNSLSRLTASKTEADSIIDILGAAAADNYSGFSANRERLLNANLADYKVIHFATHGIINETRPELSGIVLSRFDESGQKLNEFVRLQDIYGMNLNSDLVVLSACETGIGKEVRGEGLMSLNNAFLQVGAKSVMSSLWNVEDSATLELMKNFYQSLADERVTPSKALQLAQIKMWQSGRYKSPFYWAAFTVQGDFRRAPEFSRDFSYTLIFSLIGAAVLLITAFCLYIWRRGKNGFAI